MLVLSGERLCTSLPWLKSGAASRAVPVDTDPELAVVDHDQLLAGRKNQGKV
jgi:hypothetical protein